MSVSEVIANLFIELMNYQCPAMVFFDNKVALRQLEIANAALLSHNSLRTADGQSIAKDGKFHPRVLTLVRALHCLSQQQIAHSRLGGDHTITLPLLRGVAGIYGAVRCCGIFVEALTLDVDHYYAA